MECPHCGGVMSAEDTACAACGRTSAVRDRHPTWFREEIARRDQEQAKRNADFSTYHIDTHKRHLLAGAAAFSLLVGLLEPASYLLPPWFIANVLVMAPPGALAAWLVRRLHGDLLPSALTFGTVFVCANGLRLGLGISLHPPGSGIFFGIVLAAVFGNVAGGFFGVWVRDGLNQESSGP